MSLEGRHVGKEGGRKGRGWREVGRGREGGRKGRGWREVGRGREGRGDCYTYSNIIQWHHLEYLNIKHVTYYVIT